MMASSSVGIATGVRQSVLPRRRTRRIIMVRSLFGIVRADLHDHRANTRAVAAVCQFIMRLEGLL